MQKMVSKFNTLFKKPFQTYLTNNNMPTKTTKPAVKKAAKTTAKKVVKKAVKKVAPAAPKKKLASSTKKSAPKPITNFKALVCAAEGECFWTTDGAILENIHDLHMAFGSMDDEVFLHHVTKEKNDFADWVEYVLQDLECAAELRKTKKLSQAEKVLLKHLNLYNV